MTRLDDLIGKPILISIVNSDLSKSGDVTLHGVESGGIWIESPYFEDLFGYKAKQHNSATPETKPVFFVPFAQIRVLVSASIVLDEDDYK
jgi:hypothetical protein